MLTSWQLDVLVDPVAELYERYQQSVINDIARRLGKMGSVTETAAWQMQRLIESGAIYDNALEEIAKLTGQSEAVLKQMFQQAGVKGMRFDDSIYRLAGLNPLPLNLSPAMAEVLAAGLSKTGGVMRNLTMTTASAAQEAFVSAADLAYMQVSTGAMSYTEAIRDAVKGVAAHGIRTVSYAGHKDQLDVAIRRAVLTGINQTTGRLTEARATELGCDLVQTSAHIGARPEHQVWQGQVFSRSGISREYPPFIESTGYGTGAGLMGWNCVIGDTIVSGPAIRAAYRRKYTGEIIILRTARGHELTVTPNHPILTDHGWVAAGLLAEGDNVISRANLNGVDSVRPNVNDYEARIEDVFSSLIEGGDMLRFPASAGNFHGDVSDGEVDVVFPQGFLRDGNNPPLFQEKKEFSLSNAVEFADTLVPDCALDKIIFRALHSPDCIVGSFSEFSAGVRPCTLEPGTQGIRPTVSEWNPDPVQVGTHQPFRYPDFSGDFVFPHPGIIQSEKFIGGETGFAPEVGLPISTTVDAISPQAIDYSLEGAFILFSNGRGWGAFHVETDHIVSIERKPEQGSFVHVYNLHTAGEWYAANGIITHNCRHTFFPFFDGISQNAYNQADRDSFADKTVTYQGREMSVFAATQKQRYLERNIRNWKRQAEALGAGKLEAEFELAKVREWQARMRTFISETRLSRQRIREQI